ncbi:MAG: transposase [Thermoanaerobaculia bacterium]
MARPLRLEHPGAIWHVTSRGNERRAIVRSNADRHAFLEFLAEAVTLHRWILHAYVLMTNHYHLIVETPVPTLSRGVKRLNERYAETFNLHHHRVGHLVQGRFKGILVERESHLLELIRYVVLNPVRAGMVQHAGDYAWSSYRATAGLAPAPACLEVGWKRSTSSPRQLKRSPTNASSIAASSATAGVRRTTPGSRSSGSCTSAVSSSVSTCRRLSPRNRVAPNIRGRNGDSYALRSTLSSMLFPERSMSQPERSSAARTT